MVMLHPHNQGTVPGPRPSKLWRAWCTRASPTARTGGVRVVWHPNTRWWGRHPPNPQHAVQWYGVTGCWSGCDMANPYIVDACPTYGSC